MNKNGFTLIEVIISIIMISISGLVMITFLGTAFKQSGQPLQILGDNYSVLNAIEIVNADYRAKLENNPSQAISFYVKKDLSKNITGLIGIGVKGEYINFSAPDANRKVNEITAVGSSIYVLVTATKNNSRLITILGN
ncbi:MAG: prepilin-type N-terminal cleavage/methylation domain-containing protein [Deltaproteobacteria bacterium]|uniref:prepilin-type N-terminal cleavage/methylation domain-containing protein n=1 Tax=Desulfobacula sp. TaxID=2593537 RepID=UPI0019B50C60|nr:prepilin-type N-terminal cleavage/methylation domain-containing protein [Candidatus Desulfobacula maris]MBL6994284.1 prepilin-type N-terminal cleavage/methylation domain-containing protein [Desulfobacula sp.]